MKWLLPGFESNRVVNPEGVWRARGRESGPRDRPGPEEGRSCRDFRRSRAVRRPGRTWRKPLQLLAETKEPRDLSVRGSLVNWGVALVRGP